MTQSSEANLVLYKAGWCPYCAKVLRFMEAEGIELPLRDIDDPQVAEELIAIGGKRQVPCLVIDGVALYESDDIIAYLSERK